GVAVGRIAAFSWAGAAWREIPIQVDQRFPYFLANGRSAFSTYSGTDEELTYQWDVESWKKTAGECSAEYPPGAGPMRDPVGTLDDDDEISLYFGDAGTEAPPAAPGPRGTGPDRQEPAHAPDAPVPPRRRHGHDPVLPVARQRPVDGPLDAGLGGRLARRLRPRPRRPVEGAGLPAESGLERLPGRVRGRAGELGGEFRA